MVACHVSKLMRHWRLVMLDRVQRALGAGRAATVYECCVIAVNTVVAIKVFPRCEYDPVPYIQEQAMYALIHSNLRDRAWQLDIYDGTGRTRSTNSLEPNLLGRDVRQEARGEAAQPEAWPRMVELRSVNA